MPTCFSAIQGREQKKTIAEQNGKNGGISINISERKVGKLTKN